ncbi:MAG: hypothetical protein E7568_03500 [Ruminococcaceae bacterium]|nr:hypothetical protein [Oscillospiraceae bacterium]
MKRVFKKLTVILAACLLIASMFNMPIFADAGTTSITLSTSTLKKGETLTITATFTLNQANVVEGELKYDSTKLKFINATPTDDTNGKTAGVVYLVADDLAKSHYFRINFEAIADGDAAISVSGATVVGNEEENLTASSKTVKIGNAQNNPPQDTTKNKSASLTSITVAKGTLTPAFKEDITEYTVTVPYSHTDGILTCQSRDSKAKITVEGSRELKVGLNKRTIVVTSSSGEVRRYTVTFNRLDENGNDTTAVNGDSLKVTVDSKDFFIAKADETVVLPEGFTATITTYGDAQVPAYTDAEGRILLLYLVNEDQSEKGFFLLENGKVSAFYYIEYADKLYVLNTGVAAPEGYYKSTFNLGGREIPCYKYVSEAYNEYIVLAVNEGEGKEVYYRYDTKEGTMQRYPEFSDGSVVNTNTPVSEIPSEKRIVGIVLITVFALGLIALIVLVIIKISLSAKKRKESNEEYYIDDNTDTPDEF